MIPVFCEAVLTAQKIKENKDGAFISEAYLAIKDKLDSLQPKFVKGDMYACMEAGIVHLVKLGKLYYNADFSKFSLFPLEGFRQWAD